MAFWTYILLCADGLYYTGHTDNLEYRLGQHQAGAIEGFTSSRLPVRFLPVRLMWSQDFATRYEALDAEMRIKKWSRAKKEALIRGDWKAVSHFAKPPRERPPSPFASSPSTALAGAQDKLPAAPEVEMPRGYVPTLGVSTSLDTNGHRAPSESWRGDS